MAHRFHQNKVVRIKLTNLGTHALTLVAKEPLVGANKAPSPVVHKPSNDVASRAPPLPKETLDAEMNHAVKDINREREKDAPIAGIPTYAFLMHCGYRFVSLTFLAVPRSSICLTRKLLVQLRTKARVSIMMRSNRIMSSMYGLINCR